MEISSRKALYDCHWQGSRHSAQKLYASSVKAHHLYKTRTEKAT